MSIGQIGWIAIAGTIGVLLRTWVIHHLPTVQTGFPWGTLVVNLFGCFLAGMLLTYLQTADIHPFLQSALVIGFLGGFTTFSSFATDFLTLVHQKEMGTAALYVGSSVLLGCALCVLGHLVIQWTGLAKTV